ncbi:hypothetical protein EDD30_5471 [Couchioplanes caeruleus]|uniref:Uncharacterized protein n=1 Tax=Couchioplanes caeruleus TaxID=56438 RepID=A0A3N1GQK9_9ACTN|nr:hypothetical protein EDD30_5471 [Couchioplanes caeruleus]
MDEGSSARPRRHRRLGRPRFLAGHRGLSASLSRVERGRRRNATRGTARERARAGQPVNERADMQHERVRRPRERAPGTEREGAARSASEHAPAHAETLRPDPLGAAKPAPRKVRRLARYSRVAGRGGGRAELDAARPAELDAARPAELDAGDPAPGCRGRLRHRARKALPRQHGPLRHDARMGSASQRRGTCAPVRGERAGVTPGSVSVAACRCGRPVSWPTPPVRCRRPGVPPDL